MPHVSIVDTSPIVNLEPLLLAYIVPMPHMTPHSTRRTIDRLSINSLHLVVPAGDRLTLWLTPFRIQSMEWGAHLLPPHVITHERLLITHAIVPKTLSNYGASLLRFHQFCDNMCIPKELRMPSPEWLLSAFLTSRGASSVSKGAMTTWLQGLRLWHTVNHALWFGGAHLQRALQGSSNASPSSSSNSKRKPASLTHLQVLLRGLHLMNTFDAAVFAIACVAFW